MFRSIGCCVTCTQYSPADCHICIHIMTLEFEPMNQCIKYIVLEHSNVAFMIHDIGHKIYSHFDACSFADIYPYVYSVHWTLPKAVTNAVYKCQKQRNLDKNRKTPSSQNSEPELDYQQLLYQCVDFWLQIQCIFAIDLCVNFFHLNDTIYISKSI